MPLPPHSAQRPHICTRAPSYPYQRNGASPGLGIEYHSVAASRRPSTGRDSWCLIFGRLSLRKQHSKSRPCSPQRVLHHALELRAGLGCDGNRVAFNCKSAGAAEAANAGWTRACAYTAHTATRVASLTEGSGMALAVRTPNVLLGGLELRSAFHGRSC